ncbi:hypothetical protein CHGG_06251 [Chaetomium globosum CBS 148.51]|uniref:Peptidase S8/S53 domain-containing protein n=1 Tax=Chaetomium globosum (strain ATCC 6205 / CBS 148.51 / DSM 1962 / NBRC 6347 / NRRL 1970) TaxID=306901 RepID=Q2H514_CHAGB|nr:uncharacterized protein CHGG_06251 [Chaetomium globosum CBS 148.51]EAQ89632.1 hypothetical protein CHGG_06251 [Chaetomium globosum CBS 148.51]
MSHPMEGDLAFETEDDSDVLDLDDMEVELPNIAGHHIRAQGSDEAEWRKLELERQLKDVMGQLRDGHRKWGESGPPDVPPLELYKKTTLATKRDAEATRATALHILARQYKTDYADIPGEIIRPVIRDLLIQKRQALETATTRMPLHHIFAWPDEKVTVRLEADAKTVLKRAMEFVPVAKAETIAAQDVDGNTPIHYASDYRQCYQRSDEYVSIYKDMPLLRRETASPIDSSTAGKDNQPRAGPPSLRKELGAIEMNGQLVDKTKVKANPDGRSSRRMSIVEETPQERPQRRRPEDASAVRLEKTVAPSAAATNRRAKAKAYTDILQFLRLHYIRSRPDMDARDLIHGKDISDKNLYFDASGHSRANTIITLIERMSVGGFLDTLAYVYIPGLDQVTPAVKHEKPERKTYGRGRSGQVQENPKMGRNDLVSVFDKLSSCGVTRILRLQVDDLEEPAHTDSAIEMALQGTEPLASQDQEQPPARGRNSAHPSILVETWRAYAYLYPTLTRDWRKPDISPDVIAAAAPDVEHVNLYWSGNQAVLRGWGSSAGIPRLMKLKTLRVYAAPGLESVAKMNRMLDIFQNDIITNTSGRVKEVKIIPRINGLIASQNAEEQGDPTSSSTGGQVTVAQRQHVWVSTMDEFRKSMVSVHNTLRGLQLNMEPYRIKVALIDDGLELSQLLTYNGIVEAIGQSYYPPSGRTENPWHRSTEGHGTIMANMIARVNPWVSLHVMRVHNKRLQNGERTVLADSAAKAIWGAIRRRVNIISISWTVKGKKAPGVVRGPLYDDNSAAGAAGTGPGGGMDAEAEAIGKLEAAIDEAVRQNILIFCSASDQIEEDAKDSLPYRQAPGHPGGRGL